MKSGPKPDPIDRKRARNTYRPDRDGGTFQMIVPGTPPQMPDYLTAEAQAIWQEEIGRVMAGGVTELDSSLFARYCATEALARQALRMGEPVPAAVLTALRQHAELLNIAGPRSRTLKPGGGASNPFSRNGRRPGTGQE